MQKEKGRRKKEEGKAKTKGEVRSKSREIDDQLTEERGRAGSHKDTKARRTQREKAKNEGQSQTQKPGQRLSRVSRLNEKASHLNPDIRCRGMAAAP